MISFYTRLNLEKD
jgi:hypothetical protein